MAKKPKAPEPGSPPVVTDADILPENQQHEQTETPPIEADTQPSEMTAEETTILEEESKATQIERGEELPDPNEAAKNESDLSEEAQPPEPLSFEAFKAAKEAEAAAAGVAAPEEGQEDTRQEWEKPLAEIEAE